MARKILEVKNLKTYYKTRDGKRVYAVDDVSFDLKEGESLGIAGESGCGKSTLAMSVMGYYFPPLNYDTGEIIIDGKTITGMNPDDIRTSILGTEIAYIPQAAMSALNPTQKIIHFIHDIMKAHGKKMTRKETYDMAAERFKNLNLPEKVLNQYAVELSGGMKQRTVIAISTILNPKILIADEPSSALDVSSQKVVIELLHDLMKKGYVKSMLFITHELPLLYNVSNRIMIMYAGEIVERGLSEEMIFDPIHPYSKRLMGSIIVPEKGTRGKILQAIPGSPPNLISPPSGCRFAQRCMYAVDLCKEYTPETIVVDEYRKYTCRYTVDELKEMYKNE